MGRNRRFSAAVSALGFLTCVVGEAVSSPFLQRSLSPLGTDSERSTDRDGGAVDSCRLPAAELSVCGIDYLVPASLAEMAPAIEKEIEGLLADQALYRSEECKEAAQEVMCAQRFPECRERADGETEVQLTSLDCEQRLGERCSFSVLQVLLQRGFCALANATRPASGCRSLADMEAELTEPHLQHCRQDMQREVTPWMYDLLLFHDKRFGVFAEELQRAASETCYQRQAQFTCQLLGRCSEDGERVEILNTFESCEDFITCFPDAQADGLRDFYDCSQWPREAPSPTTTSPSSNTPSTRDDGWPQPTKPDSVIGSGTLHSTLSLSTSLLLLLFL